MSRIKTVIYTMLEKNPRKYKCNIITFTCSHAFVTCAVVSAACRSNVPVRSLKTDIYCYEELSILKNTKKTLFHIKSTNLTLKQKNIRPALACRDDYEISTPSLLQYRDNL